MNAGIGNFKLSHSMISFLKALLFPTIFSMIIVFSSVSQLWGMNEEECRKYLECEKEKVYTRLNTQQKINEQVTHTAKKVFQKINENWKYPPAVDKDKKMSTKSPFWEPVWVEGKAQIGGAEAVITNIPTLRFKGDPSKLKEALEDLINKPAELECTIALRTVMIFSLYEILGPTFFVPYAKNMREVFPKDDFFHELGRQFILKVEAKPTLPQAL